MGYAHSFVSFFASFFLKSEIALFHKTLARSVFYGRIICCDVFFAYLCLAGKKRKQALLRSNLPGIFPAVDASLFFDMIMFQVYGGLFMLCMRSIYTVSKLLGDKYPIEECKRLAL
jgi:hypothetical protein